MEKVPVGDVGPSFKRQPSKLPWGHISGRRLPCALAAHFYYIGHGHPRQGITSSINIVDTEPTIAETVDVPAEVPKSHVPAPGPSVH